MSEPWLFMGCQTIVRRQLVVTGARRGRAAPARRGRAAPPPAPPPAQDSPYDFPPIDPFIFTIYVSSSFHSSANAFALLLLLCPISRVGQTVYFLFFSVSLFCLCPQLQSLMYFRGSWDPVGPSITSPITLFPQYQGSKLPCPCHHCTMGCWLGRLNGALTARWML